MVADRFGDLHVHRDAAHRANRAARTDGLANGLVDAVSFRRMYIRAHFLERAGKDGDDHKVGALQRFRQRRYRLVTPTSDRIRMILQAVTNHFIRLRRC
ncbi:hypothetical protein D3C81_886320 [compost metagenome]